jgi:peptidoglycan/xylan/chitin deacetylase (PgdA/CDA1 family)
VYTNAAPLLAAVRFPATAFINSGFIDTSRVYPHDSQKFPFIFSNLSSVEVSEWVGLGFELGNHTVNHVDLGVHPLEEVKREIAQCELELRNITGQTTNLFSFPFGTVRNIRQEVVECIRASGYLALFSAHGGFVTSQTDAYDIPRLGANGDLNPLVLLMEVEGLWPNQIAAYFRSSVNRIKKRIAFGSQNR